MRMLPLLAASAALVVAFAGAADAQRFPGNNNNPPPPSRGGDPSVCVALCLPPLKVATTLNYKGCGDKLGSLRHVTGDQLRAVNTRDTVRLVPLCDVANRTLTEEQTTYLARGNIEGLLPTIARNPVLMGRLAKSGYGIDDVLGVAMGPHIALLYVSHR